MNKICVGVIGAGVWATTSHLPTLLKRRNEIEMIGVCRKGQRELQKVSIQYGFKVASENYRKILNERTDLFMGFERKGGIHENGVSGHIAFGSGGHFCMGYQLKQSETEMVTAQFFMKRPRNKVERRRTPQSTVF